MADFNVFADAVRARFKEMAQDQLFVVASDTDQIWSTYLGAFPPGTNPIFRERTEHDCSCCRHAIRDIGNIVAIQNGALSSVWDLNGLPEPYQTVANAMSAYIKALPIRNVFLTPQAKLGVDENKAMLGDVLFRFNHFAITAPSKFVSASVDEKRGATRTTRDVMVRGLTELSPGAITTILELIADKGIYRGEEHQRAVLEFQSLQTRYLAAKDEDRDLIAWTMIASPAARFRNTAIGTLAQNLSGTEDEPPLDLDVAVAKFETMVAPQNYKRPTALITKSMVEQAMKTIADLGLEQALERRHARFTDVSVNSVLFVDNAVRGQMKGGLENLLMQEVKPPKFDKDKAEEIGIAQFLADVLPKTTGLQLYLDNTLAPNFMSLTAPVTPGEGGKLLRWSNDFAWSYDGNVTDSIKDKVKRAGGQVEGVAMRVSLAWTNTDDLDLHVVEPDGTKIWYGNKRPPSTSGNLDVDMNIGGETREPVENIRWTRTPRDGSYVVIVNNYTRRESVDVGFTIEIESNRGIQTFRYDKAVGSKEDVAVCLITVSKGQVQQIAAKPGIIAGEASRDHWGLKTLDLVRVNSVVLSPNYWDENASGNKHWFFILEGCMNPLPARGIYNEFLAPGLEKHRKVFEILGDKTKCPVVNNQMSGVGFSSTRKDKVTVVATGPKLNKTYTIVF